MSKIRAFITARPVYPLVLAVHPIVFLFAANRAEVAVAALLLPLAVSVLGTIGLLWVADRVFEDPHRSALAVGTIVVGFFTYGHLRNAVDAHTVAGFVYGRDLFLGPLWLLLLGAGVLFACRTERDLKGATAALNIAALVLLAQPLLSLGIREGRVGYAQLRSAITGARGPSFEPVAAPDLDPPAGTELPDVYYIILDRYAGRQTLSEDFGYGNLRFRSFLNRRGFVSVDPAWGNYPNTTHSLAASLNMRSVDDLAERVLDDLGPEHREMHHLFERLRDNAVTRALKGAGYRYVNIGSWWEPTAGDPAADVSLRYRTVSQFTRALWDTTMLGILGRQLDLPFIDPQRQIYEISRFQFSQLERTPQRRGPKFVFAHILVPHAPWVFDRDGSYLTEDVESTRSHTENYLNQLVFTNSRMMEVIDHLIEDTSGPDPIIFLQSEEGPFPAGYHTQDPFRWDRASNDQLRYKMNILNTYYLPEEIRDRVPPTITPVNSFRFLFREVFGADLPPVPDRSWVFQDLRHPYVILDVTERLREPDPRPTRQRPVPVEDPAPAAER